MKPLIVTLIAVLLTACSQPDPLRLVTPDEAEKPASRSGFTAQSDGPGIKIHRPTKTKNLLNPFPIHIEFVPGSKNLPVNMDSLKLTYKRLWGIDLTDRVREYIDNTSIDVPETELPAGEHTIEIYIEDIAENASTQLITINVLDK